MITFIINFNYSVTTSSKLRRLSDSTTSSPDYRKSDSEKLAKLRQANKSDLSNNDRVDGQKPSSKELK